MIVGGTELFWYLIHLIKKARQTRRHTHAFKKLMNREKSVPKLARFRKNY